MNDYSLSSVKLAEETLMDQETEPPEPGLEVRIANEQASLAIDEQLLQRAIRNVFAESDYCLGAVSVAVVDDPTIHQLNQEFLEHDYPTDVLSFVLEDRPPYLEGELIVSADTAIENAAQYQWDSGSELLLYVIHGALHLVGFLDKTAEDAREMRVAESRHLRKLGRELPPNEADPSPSELPSQDEASRQ